VFQRANYSKSKNPLSYMLQH